MWILLLIAVHIKDPSDIPAKINLEFPSQESCQSALNSLTFWVKFESFKVEGKCTKKQS